MNSRRLTILPRGLRQGNATNPNHFSGRGQPEDATVRFGSNADMGAVSGARLRARVRSGSDADSMARYCLYGLRPRMARAGHRTAQTRSLTRTPWTRGPSQSRNRHTL